MELVSIEFCPCVVLVDDALDSLKHLVNELRDLGVCVETFDNASSALAFARNNIIDVCLLDVVLHEHDLSDRSGVILGEMLGGGRGDEVGLAPEAVIIFISRPEMLDTEDVLRMFNLRLGGRFRHPRLAEGFVGKFDEEHRMQMVQHVLASHFAWMGKSAQCINIKPAARERLDAQLQAKFAEFVAPLHQVVRLIRELCLSSHTSNESIEICEVSKGRSRSLVVNTRRFRETKLVDSRIVKIGALDTIEREILNYKTNVPRILRGGSYPLMVGTAFNRNLGGICYSDLGGGAGIPDSFGDSFWQMPLIQRRELLNTCLHELVCDVGGPQLAKRNPFVSRYFKRFQSLSPRSLLHASVAGMIKGSKFLTRVSERALSLQIGGSVVAEVVDPCYAMRHDMQNWAAIGYLEGVVHGDFHPDNVLIHREQSLSGAPKSVQSLHPFLIDFTHTEINHAALDYIIMDAMLRSHSLRQLLSQVPNSAAQKKIIKTWLQAEQYLSAGKTSATYEYCRDADLDCGVGEQLAELMELSFWLRDTCHKRLFVEPSGFYRAGLGFACYSFLCLPDKSDIGRLIREVLLCACATSFSAVLKQNDGVGSPWLHSGLTEVEFTLRLAHSIPLWKATLLRSVADDFSDSASWTIELNGKVHQHLNAEMPFCWQRIVDSFAIIKNGWGKETGDQCRTYPSIVDALLMHRVFVMLKDIGLEVDYVSEAAITLRKCTLFQ